MREMGRWSEDQLRDFLDIKGESHGNLRTHAELLRTAVDAETGAVGHDEGKAPATTAKNDAAGSDDEDDPFGLIKNPIDVDPILEWIEGDLRAPKGVYDS